MGSLTEWAVSRATGKPARPVPDDLFQKTGQAVNPILHAFLPRDRCPLASIPAKLSARPALLAVIR